MTMQRRVSLLILLCCVVFVGAAIGLRGHPLANTFLRGQINFAPDYRKTNRNAISTSVGQIPPNVDNAARFPHIFVCAIDRDGAGPDANPVFGATDDDVLGCARADDTGYYEMDITGSGADAGVDMYLVTWFCDNADRPFSVVGGAESFADDAELCVRMNVDATNAATRKFLRSREQTLTVGATNNLNWNLSCPNKAGSTTSVAEVVCTNAEEEPTLKGATNSSRAFNKEFAHVFRFRGGDPQDLRQRAAELGQRGQHRLRLERHERL